MLLITAARAKISQFKEIGFGGEAVIRLLKDDTVAKIFTQPEDPQFANDIDLQNAAKERLETIQRKLLEYPDDLPEEIVVPTGLLTNPQENIFGYIMPMIPNSRPISEIKKPHPELACEILIQLHDLITILHEKNVVIGDVSENNILIDNLNKIRLVDSDSMQFGPYICTTFTPRYTPPECLSTSNNLVQLAKTRDTFSDWYGFLVIAMRLFANTDPYGGVVKNMSLAQRIENHFTVFNQEVIYPASGVPLTNVPRKLLELFFKVFQNKTRLIPDRSLFHYTPKDFPYVEPPPVIKPAQQMKVPRKSKFLNHINSLTIVELQYMLDAAIAANKPRKTQTIRNVIAQRMGQPIAPKPVAYVNLVCQHPTCLNRNWKRPITRGRQPKWCPDCVQFEKNK